MITNTLGEPSLPWTCCLVVLSLVVLRPENQVLGQSGLIGPPEANGMFGGLITTGLNTALGALGVGAEHRRLRVTSTVLGASWCWS